MRFAEKKLNQCLTYPPETEPYIPEILGEGVDPAFDRAVSLLGATAKNNPKPVIDSVMYWRKGKANTSKLSSAELNQNISLHQRSVSQIDALRSEEIKADRKNTVSIFILCRVLMEIVTKTPPEVLGDDLSSKLEEIVFKQLKETVPVVYLRSTMKAANWELFAELLGKMSTTRFMRVGDEFIAELEKHTGLVPREREANVQLIIRGMRYLQVQMYPLDLLEECAEFLISIGKFFGLSQNLKIKIAYAEVLSQILLPVAGSGTAELNYPTWAKAMENLYQKSQELASKPKLWIHGFPLLVTILCVSPQEFFASRWAALLEANASKLKDKTLRNTIMVSTTRLLWVFLYRFTESLNNTTKKLDMICKPLITQNNKKLWSYVDNTFSNTVCYMIRIIGRGYLQYALENFFFPLIFSGPGYTENSTLFTLDNVAHDRAIIGIRAYLFLLSDLDDSHQPEFPTDAVLEKFPFFPTIKLNSSSCVNNQNSLKQFHEEFGRILGRMVQLCDTQLGFHGSINEEKERLLPIMPIKAQIPFHFGGETNQISQRQNYIEFFSVVLEAIPWCIPSNIPMPKLVEMLTRNSVNPDATVANMSSRVLKLLVKVRDPKTVVPVVAKYIFTVDSKIFSTYNASFSAHTDFKILLNLYTELLQIWVDTIKEKLASACEKSEDLKLNSLWTMIEEAEGNGLFFICSQDLDIRQYAFKILRLTSEFESVILGESSAKTGNLNNDGATSLSSRLIYLFETTDPLLVFKSSNPRINLSNPERRRLHKLHSMKKEGLVRLAESDHGIDTALWLKMFPLVMRLCFETYPIPVALCRNIVCGKLVQMHEAVLEFSRTQSVASSSATFHLKHLMRNHPEIVVEQWRIYLIVASTTLTQTEEQKLHVPENPTQHGRKKSVQKVTIHHQKITSAKSVFRMVIPLFGVEHPTIRDAIVTSLSSVNINIYKTLIECLQPAITGWRDEIKSLSHRDLVLKEKLERVSTEVTHVLSSTAHFLKEKTIYEDEWIISKLLSFLNELKAFLGHGDVQIDPNYQRLRYYFASLLEAIYTGVKKSTVLAKLFTYQMRVDYYIFIEAWCSNGKSWELFNSRNQAMRDRLLHQNTGRQEESLLLAALEFEKNLLQRTVCSAIAALCYGQVLTNSSSDFNLSSLLAWIESTFQNVKDGIYDVAKRALRNLLETNSEDIVIFKEAIANCYRQHVTDTVAQNYFMVVAEVILNLEDYPCQVWQLLALGLYKTGDSSVEVRKMAAKLLKAIEIKFYGATCVPEYESSLLNNTPAVYKRVMFNLSSRFSKDHPSEAFMIFSELTMFFPQVDDFSRRDILAVLLPWVQTIELQVEPIVASSDRFSPSPTAIMVLSNLFEITVVFSDKIQNEVEALWVALGNGLYPNNVKVVLDFIIHHSLEKRTTDFVEHARKILVYLSTTPAGAGLVDVLVSYLEPKSMVPRTPDSLDISLAASQHPYVANLSTLLNHDNFKDAGFSRGQLAVILLVDLSTGDQDIIRNHFPLILHVCYALLDHYLPIVQNQAREMLIRVIHLMGNHTSVTDDIIEIFRKKDQRSVWSYHNLASEKDGACTPKAMDQTIQDLFAIFENIIPDLREQWANIALSWAMSCPVRHIACRSLQTFRCLLYFLDPNMLGDMLVRLSGTIADKLPDIQGFAMQILMTLNAMTAELSPEKLLNYPQLFWAAVACLDTTSEKEFVEVLSMLSKYISKVDLNSADTVERLVAVFPPKWKGKFEGLQSCVTAGLRSDTSYEPTIRFLDKLNMFESNGLVAGSDRLCLSVLSNLPRFLHALEIEDVNADIVLVAEQLAALCEVENRTNLSRIFTSLAKNRFRSKKDFLGQTVQAIKNNFFPFYDSKSLIFLLGLLMNKTEWIKNETFEILQEILPYIDFGKPEFSEVGAELIFPLLRLLQTEYSEKVLTILQQTPLIPTNSRDRFVLKVSLGNKEEREEYEKTATIFGIPDENGWSIPLPQAATDRCRHNVHAVYYTCSVSKYEATADIAEEFQFHRDDFMMINAFPDTTDSFILADTENEGSLTNMWAELENLDSFFHAAMEPSHNRNISMTDTEVSNDMTIDPVDSAPQIYDKKVSAILNRSLARTPSTTSFKTSLADSFGNNQTYGNAYRYGKHSDRTTSGSISNKDTFVFGDSAEQSYKNDTTMPHFISVPEESDPPSSKQKFKSPKHKKDKEITSYKKQFDNTFRSKPYLDSTAMRSYQEFLPFDPNSSEVQKDKTGNSGNNGSNSSGSGNGATNGSNGESIFKLENLLRATNIGGKSKKNKAEKDKKKTNKSTVLGGSQSFSPRDIGMTGNMFGSSNLMHQRLGTGGHISSTSSSPITSGSVSPSPLAAANDRYSRNMYPRSKTPTQDQHSMSATTTPTGSVPNSIKSPYVSSNITGRSHHEMSPRSFQFPPPSNH